MPLRSVPEFRVVKREDKDRLGRELIARQLVELGGMGVGPVGRREILLLARSMESPVARALVSHATGMAAAGLRLRVIFARIERVSDARLWPGSDRRSAMSEIRWARNPRLLDAHEQLVLGTERVWIGDSMRRDPSARDAYECHAEGCSETARRTILAFERVWGASEPLSELGITAAPQNVPTPAEADAIAGALGNGGDGTPPLVSTRH